MYEEEKRVGNEFEVDVSIACKSPKKIITSIEQTINYAEVYRILQEEFAERFSFCPVDGSPLTAVPAATISEATRQPEPTIAAQAANVAEAETSKVADAVPETEKVHKAGFSVPLTAAAPPAQQQTVNASLRRPRSQWRRAQHRACRQVGSTRGSTSGNAASGPRWHSRSGGSPARGQPESWQIRRLNRESNQLSRQCID